VFSLFFFISYVLPLFVFCSGGTVVTMLAAAVVRCIKGGYLVFFFVSSGVTVSNYESEVSKSQLRQFIVWASGYGLGLVSGLLLPAHPYLLLPPPYIFYIPKRPFVNIPDYIIRKSFSRSRISLWIM